MAFISLKFLLNDNMGRINEEDVLPLAKQYADPNWIPGDWYLNQSPGYRMLFNALFGWLIVNWGFLATSVVGRLLCYGLVALGLVLIGRSLRLHFPFLMLALGLFLYAIPQQGLVACEWLLGGLEAKAVAYSLVLVAVGLMLEGYFYWTAFLLGLATSFHVLVGGWTFLVTLGWLGLRWKTRLESIQQLGLILSIYLAASVFAIPPVLEQLSTTLPASQTTPSYIYVFLRLPHHLNPLSWESDWWLNLLAYLLVLVFSIILLRRQQQDPHPKSLSHEERDFEVLLPFWQWEKGLGDEGSCKPDMLPLSTMHADCMGLLELTLLALGPFVLGLAIAPFDFEGTLLQYYPFRLGDVLLPLNTCLLFACALQQTCKGRSKQLLLLVCIGLLSAKCSTKAVTWEKYFLDLNQFPRVEPEFKALCDWVQRYTPIDAVVVSPPVELVQFTWLAERPTIAKFKLLPQTKAGIQAWYERLRDLSGNSSLWSSQDRTKDPRKKIQRALTTGYNHLTSAQADALMTKYQATFLLTHVEHQLELPIAYHNFRYVLYSKKR